MVGGFIMKRFSLDKFDLIPVSFVVVAILFAGIVILQITSKRISYKESATVTQMEYTKSKVVPYTTFMNGKVVQILYPTPEHFWVTLEYKNGNDTITQKFDSKDLYESVRLGDKVNVILYQRTYLSGETVWELQLPKEEVR